MVARHARALSASVFLCRLAPFELQARGEEWWAGCVCLHWKQVVQIALRGGEEGGERGSAGGVLPLASFQHQVDVTTPLMRRCAASRHLFNRRDKGRPHESGGVTLRNTYIKFIPLALMSSNSSGGRSIQSHYYIVNINELVNK